MNNEILEFDKIIQEYGRQLILELLNQCSLKQQKLFNRMYGNISHLKFKDMRTAYSQCKATIKKNNE